MTLRSTTLVLSMCVAGCGGAASGSFDMLFPDNRPTDLDLVMRRIESAPARTARAIAVGYSPHGSELFAFDLVERRVLWRTRAELRTAPYPAGEVVVTQEDRGIVLRYLESGEEALEADDESMHLVGADGEGDLAATVVSTGGTIGARSILYVTRNGSVAWDLAVDHALGAPAVRAGMVFVPWSSQNVSVLDGQSGAEVARLRTRAGVLSAAAVVSGSVFVGQDRAFRIDRRFIDQPVTVAPDLSALPGNTHLMGTFSDVPAPPASSVHRIMVVFDPDTTSGAGGLVYFVFYKLLFAINMDDGSVRWAHRHATDLVGARTQREGVLVADASGGVSLLSAATGQSLWSASMGLPVSVVRFQHDALQVERSSATSRPPLHEQLRQLTEDRDARLNAGQVFAVTQLARLDVAEATEGLIRICDARRNTPAVKVAACHALGQRTTGASHVLEALRRHASFLDGETSPPVGALATAAAGMNERAAARLLVAHLQDPATADRELPALFGALARLGDRRSADAVERFLSLYHAEAPTLTFLPALQAATEALIAMRGDAGRRFLERVAEDALAPEDTRDAIGEILARPPIEPNAQAEH